MKDLPDIYQNASVVWPIRKTQNEAAVLRAMKFIQRAYPLAALTFNRSDWAIKFFAFDDKRLMQICSFFDHACKIYDHELKEAA